MFDMEPRFKILVIDDEQKILNLIRDITSDKYNVITANNGEDGLEKAQVEIPDLILIDKIMPKMDGVITTQFIRKCSSTKNIPIIMLTALKESEDRLIAFKSGVDDFISKPFHPDELLSRIESKINRFKNLQGTDKSSEIISNNLRMNLNDQTVYIGKNLIHLTSVEFHILHCLLVGKGKIQTRNHLLTAVWEKKTNDTRLLDSHLASLRRKLKKFDQEIITVYGKGYVIR